MIDQLKFVAITLLVALALVACSSNEDNDENQSQTSADHGRSNTPDLRRSAGRELVLAPDIPPLKAPPSTVASAESTPPQELEPAACVNLPTLVDEDIEVTKLHVVHCDEPHTAQIFWAGSLNDNQDAPYPGYDTILSVSDQTCLDNFSEFVGVDYVDSDLEILHLRPDEVAWERGNRILACLVQHRHETTLVGTAKGSHW